MDTRSGGIDEPFDLSTVDRLLTTTRAVRRRLDLDRKVDPDVVLECLRLATHAPSASNAQDWRWVVVTDPDLRRGIARHYADADSGYLNRAAEAADDRQTGAVYRSAALLGEVLERVPVLVLACLERSVDGLAEVAVASAYASILPAVWSFQLALRSRGLGSTLTTLHLARRREVAELLGIPAGVTQAALVPVAHTIGGAFGPARRRPVEQVVSWNGWSGRRS